MYSHRNNVDAEIFLFLMNLFNTNGSPSIVSNNTLGSYIKKLWNNSMILKELFAMNLDINKLLIPNTLINI